MNFGTNPAQILPRPILLLLLTAVLSLTGCNKIKSLSGYDERSTESSTPEDQKLAKYAEVQADMSHHPFHRELILYTENNKELVLSDPQNPYHQPLSQYSNPTSPFSSAIKLLNDAAAIKADLGPLDADAGRLLTALQALNPTVKDMDAYINGHQVESDGGAKARQLDPVYRAQMKEAEEAERVFAQALTERSIAEDTVKLTKLNPDSIDFHASETNLDTRRAVEALDTLTSARSAEAKPAGRKAHAAIAQTASSTAEQTSAKAAFAASLPTIATANQNLTTAIASYKGTSIMDNCRKLNTLTTHLLATGKNAADAPFGKAMYGKNNAETFVEEYNDTLDPYTYCIHDLHTR